MPFLNFRHSFACDAAGGPGGLEVEAAGDAVEVEAFACEVETGDMFALHAAKIDFFEVDAATGDEFIFIGGLALNSIAT